MNPQFSVIIPIYNVEKYLHQCIESVLNQTFRDFELILVDDGSTDSSSTICDEFKLKDNRVKVIHKTNGGQADARNIGLKHASGEYIFFIDSDDYLVDTIVLQELSDKLISSRPDVILFKFQKFYEVSNKLEKCSFNFPQKGSGISDINWLKDLNFKDAFYNSPWSKIVRRTLLVDNNIKFEKGLLGEDNDWFYGVVLHATDYDYVDKPYVVYRQRANSTTSTTKLKNLTDLIYILEKWINNIQKNDATDGTGGVIYASLSKQYCHALIGYQRLLDKRKVNYKNTLKGLSFLLDYSKNKRVKRFKMMYKLVGFDGVIILLTMAQFILKKRCL